MAATTGKAGLIGFGEKLLRDFPGKPLETVRPSDALARAYATRLTPHLPRRRSQRREQCPTGPDALRREAIASFPRISRP
jgi:hypothetical protein